MGSPGPGHGFPFVFSLQNILAAVLLPLQCQKDHWPSARRGRSSVHLWTAFWEPQTLLTCLQIGRRVSPKEEQANWWQFLTDLMIHSLSQKGQNKTIIRVAHQHSRTLRHPTQTHWLGTSWLLALIATSRSATRALKNTMSTLQSPSLWNCLSEPSYRSGANVIIAS